MMESKAETFAQYRNLLLSIAYRMLGSFADAEDMVQETFIRWQQAGDSVVDSPRSFLVTIVSRLCINQLQSARVRREQYVGQWLPEPISTAPSSDPSIALQVDDSLSMAFLVVLERLSPLERAVFLLREVFDYEYGEIARILDQKEPACRQILHRARRHIAENRPRFEASAHDREELFRQFQDAAIRGDMTGLVAILSDDAVLYADGGGKSAAVPQPVYGAERIARFVTRAPAKFLPANLVRLVLDINGQPAVVSYLDGRPHSVFTADISGGRIRSIYIVSNPEKLSHLPLLAALSQ
jgi:RNA polymerase sigma-70 factor, ECF subfamily